jgi:hypothetical protein
VTTVAERSWRVAVSEGDYSFFNVVPCGSPMRASTRATVGLLLPSQRCAIEVLWMISGMMPHGLVVASFAPGIASDELEIEIETGGEFDLSGPATPGPLAVGPLVAGLPTEHAAALLDGVTMAAAEVGAPSGRLHVTGGGIDVDSSEVLFRVCGRILMTVAAASATADPVDEAIRQVLAAAG